MPATNTPNHTPANTQITLALDDIALSIRPTIGCSISSLAINPTHQHGQWINVLRTMPKSSTNASEAGSFVMLPWTNRIKDASFTFADQTYQLRPNANDGTAIHGVGRALPWTITDRSPITARFVLDSRAFTPESINSPFKFGAVQRFEIAPGKVEIDLSITNLDTHPIPVGCGHHPYIHRHLASPDDDLAIKLDVQGRYPTQGCIPTGEPRTDAVCQALAQGQALANPGLDDVFAGFGGLAIFDWDKSQVKMTMTCSSNMNHLVIYTPRNADGSPDEYVCIEPVTMVNDGFNALANGNPSTGTVILEPQQTLRTRMTMEFDWPSKP